MHEPRTIDTRRDHHVLAGRQRIQDSAGRALLIETAPLQDVTRAFVVRRTVEPKVKAAKGGRHEVDPQHDHGCHQQDSPTSHTGDYPTRGC